MYLLVVRGEVRIRVLQTSNIRGAYMHTSQRNFSKTRNVSLTNTVTKELVHSLLNLGGTFPHCPLSPKFTPQNLRFLHIRPYRSGSTVTQPPNL